MEHVQGSAMPPRSPRDAASARPGASRARTGQLERRAEAVLDEVVLSTEGLRQVLAMPADEPEVAEPAWQVAAGVHAEQARLLGPHPPGREERQRAAEMGRELRRAHERAQADLRADLSAHRALAADRYREVMRADPRNLGA